MIFTQIFLFGNKSTWPQYLIVVQSSITNESELLFTVISNTSLQSISTAFALRRQVKLWKTSGNRDARPSPRTALWALVLVIDSKRKYSVIILNFKIVFDKQICYENRIKLLRFKLIKGFRKIIQISLWVKKTKQNKKIIHTGKKTTKENQTKNKTENHSKSEKKNQILFLW